MKKMNMTIKNEIRRKEEVEVKIELLGKRKIKKVGDTEAGVEVLRKVRGIEVEKEAEVETGGTEVEVEKDVAEAEKKHGQGEALVGAGKDEKGVGIEAMTEINPRTKIKNSKRGNQVMKNCKYIICVCDIIIAV